MVFLFSFFFFAEDSHKSHDSKRSLEVPLGTNDQSCHFSAEDSLKRLRLGLRSGYKFCVDKVARVHYYLCINFILQLGPCDLATV